MTPIQQVLYTTSATAHGAREGRVKSEGGTLDLQLSMPKSLGGGGGEGTNPEQLFAAGYAACFHSALRGVGKREKVDVTGSSIEAQVGIGQFEPGRFGLTVTLTVDLPGVDEATAHKLLEQAHQVCPYSNATRGNIEVTLTANGAPV